MASLVAILVAPGMAMQNMTDDEFANALDIAKVAGMGQINGMSASTFYHDGLLPYSNYYNSITSSNEAIRLFNSYLRAHFNESIYNSMLIEEFSL